MFKLVKGDASKLEGRVVIYAKMDNPPKMFPDDPISSAYDRELTQRLEHVFMSSWCSTSKADLVERLRGDSIAKDAILEHSQTVQIPEKAVSGTVNLYIIPMLYIQESTFANEKADVVYAGKYKYPSTCRDVINLALGQYNIELVNQEFERTSGVITSKVTFNFQGKSEPVLIKEKEFGMHIEKNYLGKMLDAAKRREPVELIHLKRHLQTIAFHTPFLDDVQKICALINPGQEPNIEIIRAYTGRVRAIESEDYESAGMHQRAINEFEKQNARK